MADFIPKKICPMCDLPVPSQRVIDQGMSIPCSEYHVRCIRCQWPIAKNHIAPDGRCAFCMTGFDRKRYYRRTNGKKMTVGRDLETYGKTPAEVSKDRQLKKQASQRVGDLNEECSHALLSESGGI